jgi:GNAT superfamily N-acetyltransferase
VVEVSTAAVGIRPYEPGDLEACRALYAQLVEHHRDIYEDPSIGGDDPGAGFDSYLALPERVITWVAVDDQEIIGLTGLLWNDGESTVEPIVVARDRRHWGVGRRLLETAIEESRRRGATDVNIKPVARNASAIRVFHEAGFRTLGHLQLFMTLDGRSDYWRDGIDLHERRFDY